MDHGEKGLSIVQAGLIGTLALLAASCSGAGQAESSPDGRLGGDWEITLTAVPTTFEPQGGADTSTVRGTVAFVPNRAGTRVPSFGGIPQQVGMHNLRLNRMVPELGSPTTTPMAAGASTGDSVRIVLDPESGAPIQLRGKWKGADITGQWIVHRRAGIDREGRFSLRRQPP